MHTKILPANTIPYDVILQWGVNNFAEGVTFAEFQELLKQEGLGLSEDRHRYVFCELFHAGNSANATWDAIKNGTLCQLKVESYFKHIERLELKEARRSSKEATYWAITSLTLAAIVGGVQIYLAAVSPGEIATHSSEDHICLTADR